MYEDPDQRAVAKGIIDRAYDLTLDEARVLIKGFMLVGVEVRCGAIWGLIDCHEHCLLKARVTNAAEHLASQIRPRHMLGALIHAVTDTIIVAANLPLVEAGALDPALYARATHAWRFATNSPGNLSDDEPIALFKAELEMLRASPFGQSPNSVSLTASAGFDS